MESGMGGTTTASEGTTTRRLEGTAGRPAGLSPLGVLSSPVGAHAPGSPSANTGSPSPGAAGQSQHEVLQNFFQSLLSTNTKDRTANAAAASRGAAASGWRTNVPNGTGDTGS